MNLLLRQQDERSWKKQDLKFPLPSKKTSGSSGGTAASFERPYMCLVEQIPQHKETLAHQHLDLIYLATPLGNPTPHSPDPIQYFFLRGGRSNEK